MDLKGNMNRLNPVNMINGKSKKGKENPLKKTVLNKLKQTTQLDDISDNKLLQYWYNRNKFVSLEQKVNNKVLKIKEGNVDFYRYYSFSDIINNLTDILVNETFDGIEITLAGKDLPLDEFTAKSVNLSFTFEEDVFRKLFKASWLYGEAVLKANIKNGQVEFIVLEPMQYQRIGDTYEFITYNEKGEINTEPETRTKYTINEAAGLSNFDKTLVYPFRLENRFFNKIEKILTYDLVNTALPVEVELNKTKIFSDSDMWGDNELITDVVNLINVPESLKIGETNTNGYLQTMVGKNTLDQLISAKREIEKDLVNTYRLSKKALGLDAGGTDFASSLPYENQLTAMTINDYRRKLENFLNYILTDITGNQYDVQMGNYQLTSEEAVTRANMESINSKQMSISEAVSRKYSLNLDDEFVRKEIVKIKQENGIELNAEELEWETQYNLAPDPSEYDFFETTEDGDNVESDDEEVIEEE